MGGDSYGASLAGSSSAAASNSGATDVSGGGQYGSTTYGAGSLLLTQTDQRGSVGAATGGISWVTIAVVGLAIGLIVKLFR